MTKPKKTFYPCGVKTCRGAVRAFCQESKLCSKSQKKRFCKSLNKKLLHEIRKFIKACLIKNHALKKIIKSKMKKKMIKTAKHSSISKA